LTLSTAGEESIGWRLHVPVKHKVILMASAEGTGVVSKLPTIEPDFPDRFVPFLLFMHLSRLQETLSVRRTVECHNGARENF